MKNNLYHLVALAFSDFKRNKIRTFLTSLGIMIGVLSVVMLIALGLGLKNYIKEQFEGLGANMIMVMPGNMFSGEGGLAGSFDPASMMAAGIKLDEKDFNSLRNIPEVDYTVPMSFSSMVVEVDGKRATGYVMGVNEDVFKALNLQLVTGEEFGRSEVQTRAKVTVLGYSLAESLFDKPEYAQGRFLRLGSQRFRILGVSDKKGDREADNAIYIPYTTDFAYFNTDKTFFTIYLGVIADSNVEVVKNKAQELMLKRYSEDDFSITGQDELMSVVEQIFGVINGVLIAIASISLVVGGIGIMNIMYATVTERTKEVGIRRAVGATRNDILKQFLAESVILSSLGGIVGLLLATLIVLAVRPFFPLSINVFAVVITLVISSSIGIFFGVFPARRAAKLPPIEAIRYE